jgi:hypothetical protein
MPDGQTGGLQGVENDVSTIPPSTPPPPGAPPMPLPGQTVSVTQGAPPPDYKALGSGQAKADFAAAAGNGGWEFDPDAMDKVIQQLEDSLDGDYAKARTAGDMFAQLGYPGSDQVSTDYMAAASRATRAYNSFLSDTVTYLESYVDTLKQIRTAYANHDHAAINALRGVGKAD